MLRLLKVKLKSLLLVLSGKVSHLRKNIKCNYVWYGNTYGGFNVCPELINKNSIIYSFGIGEDRNPDCSCFGESVSLKLKSMEDDSALAKRQILGWDYY